MEKYSSERYQQLSFKYFAKSFSITKMLPKVCKIQTKIARGNLTYYEGKNDPLRRLLGLRATQVLAGNDYRDLEGATHLSHASQGRAGEIKYLSLLNFSAVSFSTIDFQRAQILALRM